MRAQERQTHSIFYLVSWHSKIHPLDRYSKNAQNVFKNPEIYAVYALFDKVYSKFVHSSRSPSMRMLKTNEVENQSCENTRFFLSFSFFFKPEDNPNKFLHCENDVMMQHTTGKLHPADTYTDRVEVVRRILHLNDKNTERWDGWESESEIQQI